MYLLVEKRVEIKGEVLKPGFYELLFQVKISDLIDYAGGLKAKLHQLLSSRQYYSFENRQIR